jgi:phospholipase C
MWHLLARRWRRMGNVWALVALLSMALAACAPQTSGTSGPPANIPRYQHIFLIVMENHSYDDIIGSSNAPHLNALAKQFGLATNYWAVTHPSEPNYVALIGGSYFGIADDNAYTQNALKQPSLASQLDAAHLTWKSYQEALPSPGYTGTTATTGSDVYASKHNPFMNFLPYYSADQRAAALANIVPASQLASDLKTDSAPNFGFISPGLCTDMHGDAACADNSDLITAGDTYVYNTVNTITNSTLWSQGNNAIIITWDEADGYLAFGPGNIASGGGHVATIVITSHGPREVKDGTAYNHYSLLLSIQKAFGLDCLQNSCPATGGVQPMGALFTA